MSSNQPPEPLDLERDLPTTKEDVAAQRRLRGGPGLSFDEYLQFLAGFEPPLYEELERKRGPRGNSPFQLIR